MQKQSVGIIITTSARDGLWVSVRKDSPEGGKAFAGYDQTPGGKVDAGEDPLDAVEREVLEETLLKCAPLSSDVGYFTWLTRSPYAMPDGSPYVAIHYLWVTEETPQLGEPEKNDAWRYVLIKDIPSLKLMDSTRDAITEALNRGELR